MSETETTEAFLKRVNDTWDNGGKISAYDEGCLLRLARRGAAVPDEPTEAMIEALHDRIEHYAECGLSFIEEYSLAPAYRAMLATALKDTTNE